LTVVTKAYEAMTSQGHR